MIDTLINVKQVVEHDLCVGCGACARTMSVDMSINEYGEYTPEVNGVSEKNIESASFVCPSLNPQMNESAIASALYGKECSEDPFIGYVNQSYAGYATEGQFREKGTSGGMGTWVASELLKKGLVDGVIHVKEYERKSEKDPYFEYGISSTLEEVQAASKTRYHVVELSKVLDKLEVLDGRFLLIGVPCMIKAVRRLQANGDKSAEKIGFTIALVCGHLKSINWSNSLAWGAGVNPKDTSKIQYRTKGEGIPARAYVFRATDTLGNIQQTDSVDVVGGKFNAGALMLPACEFCDDVVGETADLTIGDAWLPKFESDNNGTNLLLPRNPILASLLQNASGEGRIALFDISNKEAADSQSGGFRQRRDGLSYRLERGIENGKLVPEKRVKPGQFPVSNARKNIYDARTEVTMNSRELFKKALEENDYYIYSKGMSKPVSDLRKMEIKNSFFKLLINKISRLIRSYVR